MWDPEEYAILDYDKLQFEHVYPPSVPGETLFEVVYPAIWRLNADLYFKNDDTGEYDRIPATTQYQCFGTIPTITGGAVIPYIDMKFLTRTGMMDWKTVFAKMKQYSKHLYELVRYQVPKCWRPEDD